MDFRRHLATRRTRRPAYGINTGNGVDAAFTRAVLAVTTDALGGMISSSPTGLAVPAAGLSQISKAQPQGQ
jgi:hypothetical protein